MADGSRSSRCRTTSRTDAGTACPGGPTSRSAVSARSLMISVTKNGLPSVRRWRSSTDSADTARPAALSSSARASPSSPASSMRRVPRLRLRSARRLLNGASIVGSTVRYVAMKPTATSVRPLSANLSTSRDPASAQCRSSSAMRTGLRRLRARRNEVERVGPGGSRPCSGPLAGVAAGGAGCHPARGDQLRELASTGPGCLVDRLGVELLASSRTIWIHGEGRPPRPG